MISELNESMIDVDEQPKQMAQQEVAEHKHKHQHKKHHHHHKHHKHGGHHHHKHMKHGEKNETRQVNQSLVQSTSSSKDSFDLDPHSVSEYDASRSGIQKSFSQSLSDSAQEMDDLNSLATEAEKLKKLKEVDEIKKTTGMSTKAAEKEQRMQEIQDTADTLPESEQNNYIRREKKAFEKE